MLNLEGDLTAPKDPLHVRFGHLLDLVHAPDLCVLERPKIDAVAARLVGPESVVTRG